MARLFDGTDDKITVALGATGFVFGPGTIALLLRRNTTGSQRPFMQGTAGATRLGVRFDTAHALSLQCGATLQVGSQTLNSTEGWALVAITKASGSVLPRYHKYVFDTNTHSHSDGAAVVANNTAPTVAAVIGANNTNEFFNGDIAAIGLWDVAMSDAQIENLPFALQHWFVSQPRALWLLDQADVGQALADLSGRGANQSAITGTAVATSSVPVFNYGVGAIVEGTVAAGSPAQNILPPGIVSAEAFGLLTVARGAVTVTPSGIDAAPTFGTATVKGFNTVTPPGIDATATFGTPAVVPGVVTVTPSGIEVTPTFGTPTVSVAGTATEYSIWPSEPTPTNTSSEAVALNLGVRFMSDYAGQITAIKFYKQPTSTSAFTVALWTGDGTLLETGTRPGDSFEGWFEVPLDAPAAIDANAYYVASTFTSVHNEYNLDTQFFGGDYPTGVFSAPLFVPRYTGSAPYPTQYAYGSFQYPNNNGFGANYWVDVVLEADSGDYVLPSPASLRSSSGVSYTTRTDTTFDKPTGAVEGDLLIALFSHFGAGAAPTFTPPSGWSELVTDSLLQNGGADTYGAKVYYKFAGASEPSTYTITHTSRNTNVLCYAIQGALAATAPLATLTTATSFYSLWSRHTGEPDAITTVDPNTLVLAWGSANNSYPTGTNVPNNAQLVLTEAYSAGNNAPPNTLFYVAQGVKKGIGSTQKPRIELAAEPGFTGLIAIRPAAAGGSTQTVSPSGITATPTFGAPTVAPGVVAVSPSGISITPALGDPTVVRGVRNVTPEGIVATPTFGTANVVSGGWNITPASVVLTATFGTATVARGAVTVSPTGSVFAPGFGTATVVRGVVTVTPAGIVSTLAFGTPTVTNGGVIVSPVGISITPQFGAATVLRGQVSVTPEGVALSPVFGAAAVLRGQVSVTPAAIITTPAFGVPSVKSIFTVLPAGFASAVTFGAPAVIRGAVTLTPAGIVVGTVVEEPIVIGGQANQAFSEDRKSFILQLEDVETFLLALVDEKSFTLAIEDSKSITLPAIAMTRRNSTLEPIAIGDHRRVRRFFTLPPGLVITDAWFTIKLKETQTDLEALVFKHINLGLQPTKGRIVNADSTSGPIEMFFEILGAESTQAKAGVKYLFEIKVKRDNGEIHTLEIGTTSFFKNIIQAV